MIGNHIRGYYDGKKYLDLRESSFKSKAPQVDGAVDDLVIKSVESKPCASS